jgi:hypothetical protein
MTGAPDPEASKWLSQLAGNGGQEPFLVRRTGGGAFVIDGDCRRVVSSGLLAAALERHLGPARVVGPEELERWRHGPPIEVVSAPEGPPFVVLGGRRSRVRGLPVPHTVTDDEIQRFGEGPEIDIASANVARARLDRAVSGRYHVERVRTIMAREGPLKGAALIARRGAERVRRLFS